MAHFLIAVADYYQDITNELLLGCKARLESEQHSYEIITVAGAFELPAALQIAIESERVYDGYIVLGCVIRGETSHYDVVCNECARGIQDVALSYQVAIGFGVLTTENKAQAIARADVNGKNKGREAAEAALRMMALQQHFGV